MDRKQRGKRKHIFLCIAGLIFLSLASCAPLKESIKREVCPRSSTHEFLHTLRTAGDFENALKKCQETLSKSPKNAPGDEALFDMGLVYAHPGNPKKDYKKSVDYFKRLIKEFPRSPLIEEAKMWVGVLEDIDKAMKVDIEIEEKKKELSK